MIDINTPPPDDERKSALNQLMNDPDLTPEMKASLAAAINLGMILTELDKFLNKPTNPETK